MNVDLITYGQLRSQAHQNILIKPETHLHQQPIPLSQEQMQKLANTAESLIFFDGVGTVKKFCDYRQNTWNESTHRIHFKSFNLGGSDIPNGTLTPCW